MKVATLQFRPFGLFPRLLNSWVAAILMTACVSGAQTIGKQLVTVDQFQSSPYACKLEVERTPQIKDADWEQLFGKTTSPGGVLANYSLYVIVDDGTPNVKACDVSREYLDPARAASPCPTPAGNNNAICPVPRAKAGSHEIPLLKPLRSDLNYLVVIDNITAGKQVTAPLKLSTSLVLREKASRTRLSAISNIAVAAHQGQAVTVTRPVAKTGSPSKESYPGHVSYAGTDALQIDLDQPLPKSKSGKFSVEGISDYYGNKVAINGTIQTGGAVPASVTDAFVTTKISANAAVHQLPTYAASGALAPWHPAVRRLAFWQSPSCPSGVNCGRIWFDPTVTFDVGANTTQSANTITIPSPFSHAFIFGLPSGATSLPDEQTVMPKQVSPLAVNLSFGSREEIDTKYGAVNVMGELRAEFYLHSLSQSSAVRKATFASGNPAIRDLLELPGDGFSFAPYVQIDSGVRLTQQDLTSGSKSLLIPTYGIDRVYGGIYGIAQKGRFSLSLDSSYIDLLSTETIGYVSKSTLLMRRVSGLQPHTKVVLSTYIDQVKHYCFALTWEDGRAAPSFQYLNTVSAGLQVTY